MRKSFDAEITDLIHSIGLLVRRVRAEAGSQELSLSEAGVLRRLDKDGPMTTADLARAENMKPQSMGAIVAVLEAEGLIERRPHATDGRQMLVQLTLKGKTLRENRIAAKRSWLAQAIAQFDKDEQATLFRATELLKRLAEQ